MRTVAHGAPLRSEPTWPLSRCSPQTSRDASTQPKPPKGHFMDASNVRVPPPPPFLRLIPPLRCRIYFLAGLVPFHREWLPCLLNLHGDFDVSRLGFYGMLLSCRTVYAEASELLNPLNRSVIQMPPRSPYAMYLPQCTGFTPLRALTPSSLASLRHLTIIINESSCYPRIKGQARVKQSAL